MGWELIRTVLALSGLVFGLFFFVVGVLGIVRLPDVYSRLHASSKVATMGLLGLLFGVGLVIPVVTPRLVVLGLFVAIGSPVTSHAIAKANKRYEASHTDNA